MGPPWPDGAMAALGDLVVRVGLSESCHPQRPATRVVDAIRSWANLAVKMIEDIRRQESKT